MSSLSGTTELICPKLPSWKLGRRKSCYEGAFSYPSALKLNLERSLKNSSRWQLLKCSAYDRSNYTFKRPDEFRQEPFWLSFIRDVWWEVRSVSKFLVEQPSQLRYIEWPSFGSTQPGQLRYIEWPSFGSTLRTASLTLALVAVLIVALSSIDSGLCYLLTMLVRRKV